MNDDSLQPSLRQSCDPASEPRLDRRLVALLTVTALVLVFFKLGDYRTLGRHEAYAAVPAREMLESGDWVVPRFGGLPRLEKPPLEYWLIAASARLCGGLEEWTARLPAAVSALALAALVGVWGGRWYGRLAGLGSAVAVVSSQFVLTYSRRAEVDLPLCLITTGALFLIADQPDSERGLRAFARWVGIYLLLALSWMAKFHYGTVMVLAPAITWFVLRGRWRSLLHLLNPIGLTLLAAAIFVWPAALVEQVPEAVAVWQRETVGRAVGRLGRQPVWFYVPHVLVIAAPWTPLILLAAPASLRAAWRGLFGALRNHSIVTPNQSVEALHPTPPAPPSEGGEPEWKTTPPALPSEKGELCLRTRLRSWRIRWSQAARIDDPRERLLWIWFAVDLAGLSASAGKHSHYLAATFPMLALLAGRGVARVTDTLRRGAWTLSRRGAVAGTAVALIAATVCFVVAALRWPALASMSALAAAVVAVGGTTSVWLSHFGAYRRATATYTLMFLGCYLLANDVYLSAEDYRRPTAEFARTIRKQCLRDNTVYTYCLGMRPAVYYLQSPVQRIESRRKLAEILKQASAIPVVTTVDRLLELEELGIVEVIEQMPDRTFGRRTKDPPLLLAYLSCDAPRDYVPQQTGILRASHARPTPDRPLR